MALNSTDIEKFESFISLKKETLELIRDKAFSINFSKGNSLFIEKDNIDKVYYILDGKVTMYRFSEEGHKRVIYILGEGEFINEVIFDGLPASISCEAFEDCRLIYLNKEDLLKIIYSDSELNKVILYSMGRKIRRLYRQLKNTVPLKMDKKLAAKLWKLSKDYGVKTEEGILINLDISITYLSSMLGSTRETISKCMTRFEGEGLVKFMGKRIIIPDRNALSIYFRGMESE